ncbi:MAG: adenylate kinase [Oscillospiraceae bacterium]|nr:adenylate kinase [Oscillospiraceae bacterium]MBQ5313735.1 adenylate kinase [Oscillospiraceae bacterium]
MNIILLGAPGAGKGTQAEIICEKLSIPTISTGNILRAAMKEGTEMGLKAKSFIEAGALVPDEVIIGIVKERLAADDCKNGFILDGVPRTIAQAKAIDEMGIKIDMALDIEVRDETIIERVGGRRVCSCGASYHIKYKPSKVEGVCDACGAALTVRKDDEPQTVLDRLTTYHELTEPLKDFYREKGILVEIGGEGSVEETTQLVLKALEV